MKLISIIAASFLCVLDITYAQTIEIPDNNFLQALIDLGVDSDNDNKISISEALEITILDVNYKNIESVSGIESFTNLENLDVGDNPVSMLPLNNFPKLEFLYCQNTSLTEIDVSHCPKLKILSFNTTKIASINLENNPNIYWLDCSFTHVDSIDLTNQDSLQTIACMYTGIRSLILPNKPNLESIIASNAKIVHINIHNDTSLTTLELNGNMIIELDLSYCTSLEYLAIRDMPELYKICAPFMPFQSESLNISASGSPNHYFTDCIPPVLFVSKTEVYDGDTIIIECSEKADFYLVPDSTEANLVLIQQHQITQDEMEVNLQSELIISDTIDNEFLLYAVDLFDNISESVHITYTADTSSNSGTAITRVRKATPNITIFPNPVTDYFIINSIEADYTLTIFSLDGSMVYHESKNSQNATVNTSCLNPGIYFLTINSGKRLLHEILIKK